MREMNGGEPLLSVVLARKAFQSTQTSASSGDFQHHARKTSAQRSPLPIASRRLPAGDPDSRRVQASVNSRRNPDPMDDSHREQMLMLARGVLPELPCSIQVLSEDGGSFDLARRSRGGGAAARRRAARPHPRGAAAARPDRRRDPRPLRHRARGHRGVLAHPARGHRPPVRERRDRTRRCAARLAACEVGADAEVRVLFSRTQPNGSELEVKLADISSTGAAFNSPSPSIPATCSRSRRPSTAAS